MTGTSQQEKWICRRKCGFDPAEKVPGTAQMHRRRRRAGIHGSALHAGMHGCPTCVDLAQGAAAPSEAASHGAEEV